VQLPTLSPAVPTATYFLRTNAIRFLNSDDGMELEFTKEISALRGNMQEKALEIVRNAMPSKVLSLTAVLDSKEMNMDISAIRQPVVLTEASTGHGGEADAAEGTRKKRKLDEEGHSANDESTAKHGVKSREVIASNQVRIFPLLPLHSLAFVRIVCRRQFAEIFHFHT
jgi:hypothetical protein